MFKKDILYELLKNNQVKNITLVGKPSVNLLEALQNDKIVDFLAKHHLTKAIETTAINIHQDKVNPKLCSVGFHIDKKTDNLVLMNYVRVTLFEEVKDCYQGKITPALLDKIIGERQLSFADMVEMIDDTQTVIAQKIGKSKQLITDLKSNRINMSMETLRSFITNYPLLPWLEYIAHI